MPLLGTAATELAFSHIRKDARKNEYSEFIGNQVGKEKNTMHIKLFIEEKVKLDLTDEDLRQEALDNKRIYLEQCKKEDDRQVKKVEEIQQIERLSEQAERQHPVCPGCHKVWCECIIDHDESEL